MLYPLLLEPVYKDYIWGGDRLKTDFGKKTDISPLAESWELACHKDGTNNIVNGPCRGWRLDAYLKKHPQALCACAEDAELPILVKLIDACKDLSIQVHPNDEYARRVEGCRGKTEMWYVLDCEPGASLIYGFKQEIAKDEFRKRIENNTLLDVVNRVPVKKGDVFFIEAGTLHAICGGILIAEIQQNSNITYRVYDYGRMGKDGKPRQLHIEKAIDVTNLSTVRHKAVSKRHTVAKEGFTEELLCRYRRDEIKLVRIAGEAVLANDANSFTHLLCIEGKGVLVWQQHTINLTKGSSLFLPANLGPVRLTGKFDCLTTVCGSGQLN